MKFALSKLFLSLFLVFLVGCSPGTPDAKEATVPAKAPTKVDTPAPSTAPTAPITAPIGAPAPTTTPTTPSVVPKVAPVPLTRPPAVWPLEPPSAQVSQPVSTIPSETVRDEVSRFEVKDFGGGGDCFFYSVAGILKFLDGLPNEKDDWSNQQWVRHQMAQHVRKASATDKKRWLALVQIYQKDPLMKQHYAGVNTVEDFARRIENAAPFNIGIYEGDQLSLGIAEETFDITLAPIDIIRKNPSENHFKQGPPGNRFRKRLAFLRQTGGEASGHFQVHTYHDAKAKRTFLGYDLSDLPSIPAEVKTLIARYATQYNVDSSGIKSCRPKADACSRHDQDETKCMNLKVNQASLCIWAGASKARCEGIAGCATAKTHEECESIEKDGVPVCHFDSDACQETRLSDSEVGCRSLQNPTEETCTNLAISGKGKVIPNFCTYESGIASSCSIKVRDNPCVGLCGKDPNCEMR